MSLISAHELSVAYNGSTVINKLSFEIEQGDYICVVGENGTGKTSLLKAILGLIKHTGELKYDKELKRTQIGYLPQQTDHQKDFPASVFEVVLSGCLNKRGALPFYSKACKKLALDNLSKLDMLQYKNTSYSKLSGGQQQRVLLARALCSTGKVLLLDEPASSLDSAVSNELYKQIKKLNEIEGITIVMITHDLEKAITYSNKVLSLGHSGYSFTSTEEYLNGLGGIEL